LMHIKADVARVIAIAKDSMVYIPAPPARLVRQKK